MTVSADEDGSLRLDNQLCFLVYRPAWASPISTGRCSRHLDSPSAVPVMLALWEDSRSPSVSPANGYIWPAARCRPLLRRLQAAGFVGRRRAHDDERTVEVSPTDSGRELQSKALTVPETVGRCLVADEEDAEGSGATLGTTPSGRCRTGRNA